MSTAAQELFPAHPDFCNGMLHFGQGGTEFAELAAAPAVSQEGHCIAALGQAEVYQTQLMADALRYTTLQLCASKESGHPGGFASSADVYAALVMLGHTNIVTEVGHHAPGFYSAMFLDGSLEAMGIRDMHDLQARFRERGGLLGHLSGAIPTGQQQTRTPHITSGVGLPLGLPRRYNINGAPLGLPLAHLHVASI